MGERTRRSSTSTDSGTGTSAAPPAPVSTSDTDQPYGNSAAAECLPEDVVAERRGGVSTTVHAGDTLWAVAETTYGDGSRWHQVADQNVDAFVDVGVMLIGRGLDLPELEVTPPTATQSPSPEALHPSVSAVAWLVQLAGGGAPGAVAFLPLLTQEERDGLVANPAPLLGLGLATSIPLLEALGLDAWNVLQPTLDPAVLTTTCDPALADLIHRSPHAVDQIAVMLMDPAQLVLFFQGYQIPLADQLRVTGHPAGPYDWDLLIHVLSGVPDADRRAVLLVIRGANQWNALIGAVTADNLALVQGWIGADSGDGADQTLEQRIAAAHNSARGTTALAAVDAVAATDTNRPPRITARVRELLALGVALPRLDGVASAEEGILGVASAERAAQALVQMPLQEYARTVMLLDMSNDAARLTQSFVMLQAVAARRDQFGPTGTGGDLSAMEGFSDRIRDMDSQTTAERTTLRDIGSGGLEQQFSMTCAPTSAILMRNEADPIEAMRHMDAMDFSIDSLGGDIANEAERALEAQSAGGTLVAHVRNDRGGNVQSDVNTAVTELAGTTPAAQLQAVTQYLAGADPGPTTYTQANYDAGIAAVRAHLDMSGYPNADAMRQLHETAAARGRTAAGTAAADIEGGYGVNGLATDLNGTLDVDRVTGNTYAADFDPTIIQNGITYDASGNPTGLASPMPSSVVANTTAMLNRAAPQLERGEDVEIAVWWANGGAHAMTFLDVRGSGSSRDFLVHDTWTGQTTWVSQAAIVAGTWGGIGNGVLGSTFR